MWRCLRISSFFKIIVREKNTVRPVTPSRNHAVPAPEKVKQRHGIYVWSKIYCIKRVFGFSPRFFPIF